jgi:hypothetical protein
LFLRPLMLILNMPHESNASNHSWENTCPM